MIEIGPNLVAVLKEIAPFIFLAFIIWVCSR